MELLVSWNVNGFRSVASKGAFDGFISAESPGIICLQETKLNAHIIPRPEFQLRMKEFDGGSLAERYPHQFWHIAEKPGYSGTALLSKEAPQTVSYDFAGTCEHPKEGRVITAEFPRFIIVNAYVPNSKDGLLRLPYRMKWDADFRAHCAALAAGPKPVYLCGDFNCAHNEIDLANPADNRTSAGFTDEERAGFSALLDAGFTDTFRDAYPDAAQRYTWWSFRTKARERNIGWRIDYWLASRGSVRTSPRIHDEIYGSDHCPVSVMA